MSNQTTTAQQQSRLKELIAKGKEQGFLTYGEIARYRGRFGGGHNTPAVVVAVPA